MADIQLNSVTLATESSGTVVLDSAVTGIPGAGVTGTLPNAVQDNITRLGTVTTDLTLTGDLVPSTPLSYRNMIINGAFQMWQRSDSTSMETVANNNLKADRFKLNSDIQASDLTCGRSIDVPAGQGFTNSMKVVPGGADTSQAAGHIATIVQFIEAQNLQHLCYGTSNAKSLTLSFWVKTNLAGSHSVSLVKDDSTAYACPIEYTVSAANTWEKKEITFSPTAGSTSLITASGGAITNDNGRGLAVCWNLAAGSTYRGTNNTWQAGPASGYGLGTSNIQNFVGSTSNDFFLTGVQLELGSNATPFEHRSYGDELARCQRYCYATNSETAGAGRTSNTNGVHVTYYIPASMRAVPTFNLAPGQSAQNYRTLTHSAQTGSTNHSSVNVYGSTGAMVGIFLELTGSGYWTDARTCTVQFREGFMFTAEL